MKMGGKYGTHNLHTAYYMEPYYWAVKREFWRAGTQNCKLWESGKKIVTCDVESEKLIFDLPVDSLCQPLNYSKLFLLSPSAKITQELLLYN